MTTHTKWGNKFTCFKCGCKFYDLNRPLAICPKCGADQAERDVEVLLVEPPVSEEGPVEEEEIEVPEEEEAATAEEGGEEELPEMEEELGYDETEEEE